MLNVENIEQELRNLSSQHYEQINNSESLANPLNNNTNENDELLAYEYRNVRDLQRVHDDGGRSICCFGCTSPDVLLVHLILFLVAITFFDTNGNYDAKCFEGLAVYVLAFCIIAALISTEKIYMKIANIICILCIIWHFVFIYLLVTVHYELKSNSNVPRIVIGTIENCWYDLVVYLKKLIYEDYLGYIILNIIKIIFFGALLITQNQVSFLQEIKSELNQRHRRIGQLLNLQMQSDQPARPVNAFQRSVSMMQILPENSGNGANSPSNNNVQQTDSLITAIGFSGDEEVGLQTAILCTNNSSSIFNLNYYNNEESKA